MTWFKVDDNLAFHPKVLAAGNAAMGLWVRAGSWSAQQLTDGRIPDSILLSLGTVKQAETLARVGLWTRAADAWQFHEWSETGRQPTRAIVEAERAAATERQRKHRELRGTSRRDETVSHSVSHAPVTPLVTPTPTRPDPTRPIKKASPSRSAEIRLPKDWSPTPEHEARAVELRVNCKDQADLFRLHAETHDRHAANWNAAFTMWLKKATPASTVKRLPPDKEWMNRA